MSVVSFVIVHLSDFEKLFLINILQDEIHRRILVTIIGASINVWVTKGFLYKSYEEEAWDSSGPEKAN